MEVLRLEQSAMDPSGIRRMDGIGWEKGASPWCFVSQKATTTLFLESGMFSGEVKSHTAS